MGAESGGEKLRKIGVACENPSLDRKQPISLLCIPVYSFEFGYPCLNRITLAEESLGVSTTSAV
jgi:hypothetical protein